MANNEINFSDNGGILEEITVELNPQKIEDDSIETLEAINIDSNDEVLQLSEYNGGLMQNDNNNYGVIAEYNPVSLPEIETKHIAKVKNFVTKVNNFIMKFGDIEITKEHKEYFDFIVDIESKNLIDLMSLLEVNKQMLNNIVHRVNATMAEDYAIIGTYNQLLNQHIKLTKELQNTYRSIPATIKRMKTEITCNQELIGEGNAGDEVITEDYGTSQFNNGKQLLSMIENYNKNKTENK